MSKKKIPFINYLEEVFFIAAEKFLQDPKYKLLKKRVYIDKNFSIELFILDLSITSSEEYNQYKYKGTINKSQLIPSNEGSILNQIIEDIEFIDIPDNVAKVEITKTNTKFKITYDLLFKKYLNVIHNYYPDLLNFTTKNSNHNSESFLLLENSLLNFRHVFGKSNNHDCKELCNSKLPLKSMPDSMVRGSYSLSEDFFLSGHKLSESFSILKNRMWAGFYNTSKKEDILNRRNELEKFSKERSKEETKDFTIPNYNSFDFKQYTYFIDSENSFVTFSSIPNLAIYFYNKNLLSALNYHLYELKKNKNYLEENIENFSKKNKFTDLELIKDKKIAVEEVTYIFSKKAFDMLSKYLTEEDLNNISNIWINTLEGSNLLKNNQQNIDMLSTQGKVLKGFIPSLTHGKEIDIFINKFDNSETKEQKEKELISIILTSMENTRELKSIHFNLSSAQKRYESIGGLNQYSKKNMRLVSETLEQLVKNILRNKINIIFELYEKEELEDLFSTNEVLYTNQFWNKCVNSEKEEIQFKESYLKDRFFYIDLNKLIREECCE